MSLDPAQPLVSPLPDPALALRRQTLISGLFKHVAEVKEIEDRYAFRFRRSELITRRIAGYIPFEGQHSPQVTFVIITEANSGSLWLGERGFKDERELA
jgi:hypothetical protein